MKCMLKFQKKSCGICKAQDVDMTEYQNSSGTHMIFCHSCKRYPERRSFEVVKHYPGNKVNNGEYQVNKQF